MHGLSFKDRHLVAKDSRNLNSTINTCSTILNNILYHSYLLNIYECLICQIYH